jgi:hypothetical protein
MKNQVKRFAQFVNEMHHSGHHFGHEMHRDFDDRHNRRFDDTEEEFGDRYNSAELSTCCNSEIDPDGYCTECGEDQGHQLPAPPEEINLNMDELYEAKKKAQIEALKAVDKKFANLKPAPKKKAKPAEEEEEEMEESPKKGANSKPAAKGMPFGKKETKPAAKGMPFGKPAAKSTKPFGFQKKGANSENEM